MPSQRQPCGTRGASLLITLVVLLWRTTPALSQRKAPASFSLLEDVSNRPDYERIRATAFDGVSPAPRLRSVHVLRGPGIQTAAIRAELARHDILAGSYVTLESDSIALQLDSFHARQPPSASTGQQQQQQQAPRQQLLAGGPKEPTPGCAALDLRQESEEYTEVLHADALRRGLSVLLITGIPKAAFFSADVAYRACKHAATHSAVVVSRDVVEAAEVAAVAANANSQWVVLDLVVQEHNRVAALWPRYVGLADQGFVLEIVEPGVGSGELPTSDVVVSPPSESDAAQTGPVASAVGLQSGLLDECLDRGSSASALVRDWTILAEITQRSEVKTIEVAPLMSLRAEQLYARGDAECESALPPSRPCATLPDAPRHTPPPSQPPPATTHAPSKHGNNVTVIVGASALVLAFCGAAVFGFRRKRRRRRRAAPTDVDFDSPYLPAPH